MDFIPHTQNETRQMLDLAGLESTQELFRTIPTSLLNPAISLPAALSELEIAEEMELSAKANPGAEMISFLGGGAYNHFIPKALESLLSRSDFVTAYTPYQAEASQGTLQAIYEFQTYMCRLTGMEAANASMYDGASALAEAALMACRLSRKNKVFFSAAVNPYYLEVVRTYFSGSGIELVTIPLLDGCVDLGWLEKNLDAGTAAVFIQNPNFYGLLEPAEAIGKLVKNQKSIYGVTVYPHSLGCLKTPASYGAEIVCGDLQSFGLPLSFGGPYAGFIATKMDFVRQLPGRLVGRTKDSEGKTSFVLTLQTREQHIRRAKATSNICSNQGLCTLAATIYLALIGPKGLRKATERSIRNAHVLQERLCAISGVTLAFNHPFFNEFVLKLPVPAQEVVEKAQSAGLLAGIPVGDNTLLVCATEKTKAADIERYVEF